MEKPAQYHSIAVATRMLTGGAITFLPAGCQQRQPYDGSFLDLRLTGANSVADIEDTFRAVSARKYEDPSKGFSVYQVTNGATPFILVQAFNWPRGLAAFNLFCYEQIKPDKWVLRGLAPVNEYYYTNGDSMTVSFVTEGEYVKAVYRGAVVFTATSQSKQSVTRSQPPQR